MANLGVSKFSKPTCLTNLRGLWRYLGGKQKRFWDIFQNKLQKIWHPLKIPSEASILYLLWGNSQGFTCQGNVSESEWQPGSVSVCCVDHMGLQLTWQMPSQLATGDRPEPSWDWFVGGSEAWAPPRSSVIALHVGLERGSAWILCLCYLRTACPCPIFPQTHRPPPTPTVGAF